MSRNSTEPNGRTKSIQQRLHSAGTILMVAGRSLAFAAAILGAIKSVRRGPA